jgi:hypothetical protein
MNIKFNRKELFIVLALCAVAGLVAQYISFTDEYVLAYRDSIYRLDASRRFLDALQPGFFNQLGTVWLPLPNIIMFPLVSIDILWKTGLAGSIVNFIAYIFNCLAIFYILKLITKNKFAQYAGLILFISNPNILYFQTTAMSEQLYLTFFTVAIYYILKWDETNFTKYIWYSGIFTAMASCTRYDGWTFAIAAGLIIFFTSFISNGKPFRITFYYIFPTAFIIIWWLIHNYIYYADALEFLRGQFSTAYQLKYYESAGRLLTKHNFGLSTKVYYYDLYLYSGFLTLILSVPGLIFYFLKNKFNIKTFIVYLSLIAIPSTFLFLYFGQIIIELPQSFPTGYFNSRYGLYAIPGLVIFAGYFCDIIVENYKKYKKYVYAISILLLIIQIYVYQYEYPTKVPAIAEARYAGYKGTITYNLSKYLEANYDGGNLLFDTRIFALPPWSGVNLKERITFHTYEIGKKALENPVPYAKWVMFYTNSTDDIIYNSLNKNNNFRENYILVYSEDGLELYKRK